MAYNVDMAKIKSLVDRAQNDQTNTGFHKNGWYNMKDGVQVVRFLPPWSAAGVPSKEVHKHYSVPPDNKTLMCIGPANFQNVQPCPVCEAEHEAFKAGVKLKCRAQPRFFLNGIVRNVAEDEPVIVEIPAMLHRQLMTLCGTPEIGNFFDPYQGSDVMVTRTTTPNKGNSTKTEYTVQILTHVRGMVFSPEKGGQAKTDHVLSKMADLDKIFIFPNSDEKMAQYRNANMAIRTIAAQRTGVMPTMGTPYGANAYPSNTPPAQPTPYPQPGVAPTQSSPSMPWTPPAQPYTPPPMTPSSIMPPSAMNPNVVAPAWTPPAPMAPPPPPQAAPSTVVAADPKVKASFPQGFPVKVAADEWTPGKGAGAPECYGNISAVRPVAQDVCARCRFLYPCSMVEGKYRAMAAGR